MNLVVIQQDIGSRDLGGKQSRAREPVKIEAM